MHRLALIAVLGVVACGGHDFGEPDETVGATCTRDSQCDDRCLIDSADFPGGFCTLSCLSDRDCPEDTYCVTSQGGVCLFICPDVDCANLGPGWSCKEQDHVGGGKVNVCKGD